LWRKWGAVALVVAALGALVVFFAWDVAGRKHVRLSIVDPEEASFVLVTKNVVVDDTSRYSDEQLPGLDRSPIFLGAAALRLNPIANTFPGGDDAGLEGRRFVVARLSWVGGTLDAVCDGFDDRGGFAMVDESEPGRRPVVSAEAHEQALFKIGIIEPSKVQVGNLLEQISPLKRWECLRHFRGSVRGINSGASRNSGEIERPEKKGRADNPKRNLDLVEKHDIFGSIRRAPLFAQIGFIMALGIGAFGILPVVSIGFEL